MEDCGLDKAKGGLSRFSAKFPFPENQLLRMHMRKIVQERGGSVRAVLVASSAFLLLGCRCGSGIHIKDT